MARHWRNQADVRPPRLVLEAERWQERYDTQRQLAALEVNATDQGRVNVADVGRVARL